MAIIKCLSLQEKKSSSEPQIKAHLFTMMGNYFNLINLFIFVPRLQKTTFRKINRTVVLEANAEKEQLIKDPELEK